MNGHLLHLLRHGAPETPGLLLGHRDMASSEAAIVACAAGAEELEFHHLVTSDLRRARLVAERIGHARNLPVVADRRWRELDFGAWDGLAPSALAADELRRFHDDPDGFPPPGGERWAALLARVAAALAALPAADALVVTHGGAMRAALHLLCGFAPARTFAFDLPYASLLTFRVWPEGAQIVRLRP